LLLYISGSKFPFQVAFLELDRRAALELGRTEKDSIRKSPRKMRD